MHDMIPNPFNITKADDFSDQEITDYWVDIPSGAGFAAMAKPTSPMPMLILGGKGSGKTHLMRYFSYSLQRIRHAPDVIRGIKKDGYIGIYLRCGGLNSTRFKGKGQKEEVWADIFAYYMELWMSQLALAAILSAVEGTKELTNCEPTITAKLTALIDLYGRSSPVGLAGLIATLRELQQELDSAVNNSAITRTLAARIRITRGDLIFGIPDIVAACLPAFHDCLFLYLIDEFENLLETQQKYVQTLLRERRGACSFKVGTRLYGVKTKSTYSADEENKEGSEFEVLRLDAVLRENKQYGEFAKRLITKRLAEFTRGQSVVTTLHPNVQSLDKCFEEPAESQFCTSETAYVIGKYHGRERPYFKELRQHLERGLRLHVARGLRDETDIGKVIQLLSRPEFPLLEKANIFFFYQDWRSKCDLLAAARRISDDCDRYLEDRQKKSRYKVGLSHFKADLLAQLFRETDQPQRYVGFATFVEISSGLPRNLLLLLKHIFSWAVFNGERPFRGTAITMRSQQAGVFEASEWFFRDAQMMGREGQPVMDAVDRLGNLFRAVRFSEKPSECSCSSFSTNVSRCSETARRVLELAENWSLLLDVGRQADRNTKRIDRKFQLSRMLAPRWDLSIYRRGVIALTSMEVNSVFDPEHFKEFDQLSDTRIARMRPPLFGQPPKVERKKRENGPLPLFDAPEHA